MAVQTTSQLTASSRMRSAILAGKWDTLHPSAGQSPPKPKEEHVEHRSTKKTHHLQGNEQSSDDDASINSEFLLYKMGSRSSDPITVSMLLNGKELAMEVDAGAALSVISESTQQSVFPKSLCTPPN